MDNGTLWFLLFIGSALTLLPLVGYIEQRITTRHLERQRPKRRELVVHPPIHLWRMTR